MVILLGSSAIAGATTAIAGGGALFASACVVACAVLSLYVLSGQRFVIRPLSFGFMMVAYLMFVGGLQPMARLVWGEYDYFGWDVRKGLAGASWLTLAAMAAFMAGYCVCSPRSPRSRTRPVAPSGLVTRSADRRYGLWLIVVGAVMYVAWLLFSGSSLTAGLKLVQNSDTATVERGAGPSIKYLLLGLDVVMVGVVFLYGWCVTVNRLVMGAVVIATGLVAFALLGFRFRLMIMVVGGVVYLVKSGRYRLRSRHIVAVLAIGLVVFPAIGYYRAPAELRPVSYEYSAVFLRAFDLSAALSVVTDQVPDGIAYLNGASYTPLVTQWIPAAIAPEKARSGTIELLDTLTDPGAGASLPLWGEMYSNFGWYGTVCGMALVGALAFRLDRWARSVDGWFAVGLFGVALGFWIHVLSRGNMVNQISVGVVLFGVPLLVRSLSERLRSKGATSNVHKLVSPEVVTRSRSN